jgi:hypothetical protein
VGDDGRVQTTTGDDGSLQATRDDDGNVQDEATTTLIGADYNLESVTTGILQGVTIAIYKGRRSDDELQ